MRYRMLGTALLVSGLLAPSIGSGQTTSSVAFNLRSYPAGGEPRAIAAADFNDDGAPDFAAANLTLAGGAGSGVAVFLNNGDGTFAAAVPIATGAGAFDLATADFNRDGRVDLAVSNADANTVTILLSSEAGLIPTFSWATSASPRGIVAGDFTRDGRIDLAVVAYNCGCVDVGGGNGDGTITTVRTFELAPSPERITTADFNRDGTLDLFVGTAGGRVFVLFGSTDGQFVEIRDDPHGIPVRGVDTGDFDGDGRADVVVVGDRSTAIFHRIPSGQVGASGSGGPTPDLRGVVVFDVNNDGWADFAQAARSEGTVGVAVNGRSGGIGLSASARFAVGAGARAVAAADLDGDGRTDLISANQYARTVTVMINQTPRFTPTTEVK
jgi:hypothetical protein